MAQHIKDTITEMVKNLSSAQNISFSSDTDLFSVGILDSLGMVEFIQSLEEGFKIQFKNEDLIPQHFWSVDAASATVAKYAAK